MFTLSILLSLFIVSSDAQDLCEIQGCQCNEQSLICHGVSETLSLSPSTVSSGLQEARLSSCASVELATGLIEHAAGLRTIVVNDTDHVRVQSRLTGKSDHEMHKLVFSDIKSLEVERQALGGLRLDILHLERVSMPNVGSLSFDPSWVGEFTIIGSNFDRVSIWGFKFRADELNVLGNCVFASLASRAFEISTQKLMLAYNQFRALHDSAFDIEYGLADVQGNTFRVMTGKPFMALRPNTSAGEGRFGLIFRENSFGSESMRMFAALAMPHFAQLLSSDAAYVDVEQNRFVCECQSLEWFLALNGPAAAGQDNVDDLDPSGGSVAFMRRLYESADKCLLCDSEQCVPGQRSFKEFAEEALDTDNTSCDINQNNEVDGDEAYGSYGEEEDQVEVEGVTGNALKTDSSLLSLLLISLAMMFLFP